MAFLGVWEICITRHWRSVSQGKHREGFNLEGLHLHEGSGRPPTRDVT